MRICHVITRLIVGGAQENTILTCEGLAARGHDVTLMAGPETGPEGSLWDRADRGGYERVRIESLRRSVHPLADWRAWHALRSELAARKPDMVHTHSSKAGVLGRLAAPTGARVVHTIHGMSFNRTQSLAARSVYRLLERWVASGTDAFISVSDAMTDQAVAAGVASRDRFFTVYSGMDVSRFRADGEARRRVRQSWGVPDEAVVIGTVARLFRNKGYESLLRIMPELSAANEMVRYVWVGGGRDRVRYERALEALGLRDRVHLTGLVSPDEIPAILSGFDLLVHASRWEGLPRAVVQALLCEVPVVCFDNDGAPEVVIPSKTGVLVACGDHDSLARGVRDLCGDSSLRRQLGREGRRRGLERFDHERMVEQIERVYEHVLGGGADAARPDRVTSL